LKPHLLHHLTNKMMNWGTKLTIAMLSFMCFIIVLGVLMMTSKSDALVDTDYYEKGIRYNETYTKKENLRRDHAAPVILIQGDTLLVSFKQDAAGSIKLIRTADKRMDVNMVLQTDARHQFRIPVKGRARGSWKVLADWKSKTKAYTYEQEVML